MNIKIKYIQFIHPLNKLRIYEFIVMKERQKEGRKGREREKEREKGKIFPSRTPQASGWWAALGPGGWEVTGAGEGGA